MFTIMNTQSLRERMMTVSVLHCERPSLALTKQLTSNYAFMKKSKRPQRLGIEDQVNAPARIATSQENIPGEEIGSHPAPFRFLANVNLNAVADFVVMAANEKEAETKAKQLLDAAEFKITRQPKDDVSFCVSVHPECVECEILGIEDS